MTVLRELIARLGFEVDKAGFAAAQKGVGAVNTVLRETAVAAKNASNSGDSLVKQLGQLAASVGLTALLHNMVEMASSAQETSSLLDQVFGKAGGDQVRQWSVDMSAELGRSKFALQEFAGALGAVIDPMVGDKAKAEEMATTLSTLAVDLASFFNATDADAMHALRSGLTGEYESLKRFGVVLNDVTLQQLASEQGIKKKVTAMTIAEKTELRYAYIMKASKNAQGDAARTANGFANASRALKDSLRDLGTMMGQAVLPYIEKLIFVARDALAKFKQYAEGTYILKAAMMVLSAAAAALGWSMLRAFIIPAVAVLALVWAVDQLHALFKGGRSDIGAWLDAWGGAGTAAKFVNTMTSAVEKLSAALGILSGRIGAYDTLAAAFPNSALGDWATKQSMEMRKLSHSGIPNGLGPDIHPSYGGTSPQVRPSRAFRADFGEYSIVPYTDRPQAPEDRPTAEGFQADRPPLPAQYEELPATAPAPVAYRPRAPADYVPMATGPTAGGAPATVNVGPTTVNVNVSGGDPRAVKRAVEDALDARDRRAMASLPDQPWSE